MTDEGPVYVFHAGDNANWTEKFIVGNSENEIALLIFYAQTGTQAFVMPVALNVWHEDTMQTSTYS